MRITTYGPTVLLWTAVLLAPAAWAHAGPVKTSEFAISWDDHIGQLPTADTEDPVAAYLGAETLAPITEIDVHVLARSVPWPEAGPLPALAAHEPVIRTFSAPAVPPPVPPAPPAPPPTRLASLTYPEATGLADLGSGGRDVPLGDARYFNSGPGGYGTVLSGPPPGGLENWSHVTRTAISYIRPNVNVQMMLALDLPGGALGGEFEGPAVTPKALLAIDRNTEVHSADIGATTPRFGRPVRADPQQEPQTAVAAGLDLGLLPTFLSQMGMGLSVVASRGEETGNLRLALVGTTELPVDWTPIERPYLHPAGAGRTELVTTNPWLYPSNTPGEGREPEDGNGGGGNGKTPITPNPPVPEPATLLALAGGAAALLAGRRKRRR